MKALTLKSFSLWFGQFVAFFAILYSLLFQPAGWCALTVFLLGLAYFILAFKNDRSYFLYPGGILISIAYWKVLGGTLKGTDFFLPLFFPFTFLFIFLGYLFRKRGKDGKGHFIPLEITGHVAPLWMGLTILAWPAMIKHPFFPFVALVAFLFLDLWLAKRYEEKWFLFPATLFLFLCYGLFLQLLMPISILQRAFFFPIIILVIFFWGCLLQRRKGLDYVKPLHGANIFVCLFMTFLIFARGEIYPDLTILFASAFIYTFLMILYKRDDIGYLLLFSLAVFAINHLAKKENSFYREYYDYFFYGLIAVGLLLLYSAMKRWFGFNPDIASYLGQRWIRVFWIFLPVSLGILFLFFAYGKMYIENPTFCGSCHNMTSFYRSWEKDFHVAERKPGMAGNPVPVVSPIAKESTTTKEASQVKPVGCFECHYPPGVGPWLKMKSTGYMELMTFLMGDLSIKPQGQVWDEACLREGCHVKEKLYRNIVYKKNIKFNHEVMISQRVRGMDLRCSTCHSYIGAYLGEGKKHFEVHPSTCYFCHLVSRAEEAGVKVGTCYTCHDPSVEIDSSTFVDVGTGRVTEEKCFMCHEKILKFQDAQYQHDVHINRHKTLSTEKMNRRKIECIDCHTEIQHGNFGKKVSKGE